MSGVSAPAAPRPPAEDVRTGLGVEAIKRDFLDNLFYVQARFPAVATRNDRYMALAVTVRDRLLKRWIATSATYFARRSRTVCYLSAEFLLGPHLGVNLLNLGIMNEARQAMRDLGLDLDDLLAQEEEPGLGNGGLGRLAACFLDSLATLRIPAIGYGIRYEFGIFSQRIRDGWQVEVTDKWLHLGNPWEIPRPEIAFEVKLGGRTEHYVDSAGRYRVRWIADKVVRGIAYDTPILGYRVNNANLLRLWKAEACESFDFQAFNVGDYYGAVDEKIRSETISKILYPNDEPTAGKALRLAQQYFFVACSLKDMVRILMQAERRIDRFADKYAVQLNDTHPALAVAELMRILVDDHDMDWEPAWAVTRRAFAYTNHTLLPEALEKWPTGLFASLLPRHMEIVYEINRRFLDEVRARRPGDDELAARLSLVDEGAERAVRMAHLACVGSHTVNGVAALHSRLLKAETFRDFAALWPERFTNVTNGVTPRRFLALANPGLAGLLDRAVGEGWRSDLERLKALEPLAADPGFRAEWRRVKGQAKAALAEAVRRRAGVVVDPASLFDVQAKRIHEYKRQHLNVLRLVALYHRLRRDPATAGPPHTALFAGKAAPGYVMAKLIIRLVNAVAETVNADPLTRDRLRVAFLPDFNVKNAQALYPAADLSEQISTAGKEASGTGNMKFAMNGALTIGTLDGANVEIREAVGADNFFLFGLTAEEVARAKAAGYRPRDVYAADEELREALDAVAGGRFGGGAGLFRPLVDSLLERDEYMVLADFRAYMAAQDRAAAAFAEAEGWSAMSIRNVARIGRFSSDRAIAEYCRDVWKAGPVAVDLDALPAAATATAAAAQG
jgi:starch phosphorylase